MIKHYSGLILSAFLFLSISNAKAQANFTFNPHEGCDVATVHFQDQSSGASSWVWTSNGNQFSTLASPTNIFSSPGTYAITLTINGGSSSHTDTVHVWQSPTASFSTVSDTTCSGVLTQFTSTSTPGSGTLTQYIWTWGDGSGDTVAVPVTTHLYAFPGTFSSNLVVYDSHGCHSQSVPHTIIVLPGPNVSFTMDSTYGCTFPNNVVFTNTSNPAASSYVWTFGDPGSGSSDTAITQNASHLYNAPGVYTITLTGVLGSCSDSYSLNYYLQPETASFNIANDTICFGDTAFFSNTSNPTAGSVSWNFGDPGSGASNTSNLSSPFHIFSAPGLYTVTLNATAANTNCVGTITHTVYVRPLPVVTFTNTDSTNCQPPWSVTFTGAGPNIANWYWIYGDGTTGNTGSASISHSYTSYGIIDTIGVIATDIYGCVSDTAFHFNDVQIIAPTFSILNLPDSGCYPLTINIQTSSTFGPGNYADSIVWDFGDGTPILTAGGSVTHTFNYTPPGIYTVHATLYTHDGCVLQASGMVFVGAMPNADFDWSPDTVCYGDMVHFWSLSTAGGTPITGYEWSIGGMDSSLNTSTVGWDTGYTSVTLTVYSNGCKDTITYDSTVYIKGPIPRFSFTYSCEPQPSRYTVQFVSNSVDAEQIVWDFGDGSPHDSTNSSNISHTFPNRGIFSVVLTAYNFTNNCQFSETHQVEIVDAQAWPASVPDTACYPVNAFLIGTNSQDADYPSNPLAYQWNFGNPSSGVLNTSLWPDTFHLFNDTGVYNVRLVVTDKHGCVDTNYVQVYSIGPHPAFFATDSSGCLPFTTGFNASPSVDFMGNITNYNWNFNYPAAGSTASTSADTVSWTYLSSGLYTIRLITTDNNGCRDTTYQSSYIRVLHPYPTIVNPDTFLCTNSPFTYTGSVNDIAGSSPYNFVWNFGDGTIITHNGVSASTDVATHGYATNNTTYTITLTVTDNEGCTDSTKVNVFVLNPLPNASVVATDSCGYTHAQYTSVNNTFNTQWQWNITGPSGYVSSSIYQNPTFNFTVPGTYSATVTVWNGGCSATQTLNNVTVNHPVAHFDYTPQSHCPPVPITFTTHLDSQTPYIYVQWVFGDGHTANTYWPDSVYNYTYYTPGTFMPNALIAYTLSNGDTCLYEDTNIVMQPIVVTGGLSVNITQDSILVLEGYTDTLTSTYIDLNNNPPYTYNWTVYPDGSGVPNFNTTEALYTADSADTYIVLELTDNAGCKAYDTVDVIVRLCEHNILIPNVFTPNGDNFNDTYHIKDLCPLEGFWIKIFNRWGNVVFESSAYDFAWDGKDDNGKECNDGTYYYVLHAKKKNLHGYIQLIREKGSK